MPKPLNSDLPESKVTAEPKLEKRERRSHSSEYKIKIIAEADACQHGELGQLLRREGLYSGQLKQWREELANANHEKLSKTKPGPSAKLTAEQREIEKLKAKIAQLSRELEITQGCVDLQKKALAMLDLQSNGKKP
jgi:transposase-like protein